jgi:hypothetical protein
MVPGPIFSEIVDDLGLALDEFSEEDPMGWLE